MNEETQTYTIDPSQIDTSQINPSILSNVSGSNTTAPNYTDLINQYLNSTGAGTGTGTDGTTEAVGTVNALDLLGLGGLGDIMQYIYIYSAVMSGIFIIGFIIYLVTKIRDRHANKRMQKDIGAIRNLLELLVKQNGITVPDEFLAPVSKRTKKNKREKSIEYIPTVQAATPVYSGNKQSASIPNPVAAVAPTENNLNTISTPSPESSPTQNTSP